MSDIAAILLLPASGFSPDAVCRYGHRIHFYKNIQVDMNDGCKWKKNCL
jgi:hypothetical protein